MIVRTVVRVAFDRISAFVEHLSRVADVSDLRLLLGDICPELGFSHFALVHHVDARSGSDNAIRIHNYPDGLEHFHDEQRLGSSDPVHRACQRTALGFTWSELPNIIQLTPRDMRILATAANEGVGDGFTVPAHLPGEFSGSCSFATARGTQLQPENLTLAQLVGAFAFQAARRLTRTANTRIPRPIRLSDRERECLIWIARGKSDSEIATILGISDHTVHQYVKHARETYDVVSRSQLIARALCAGTLSFLDIVGH